MQKSLRGISFPEYTSSSRDLARSQCESYTRDELIVYIEKMRLLSRA